MLCPVLKFTLTALHPVLMETDREEGERRVCLCCSDSNEVSNEKLSAARRRLRPRDSVETHYTCTHRRTIYIQTHSLGVAWPITTHHPHKVAATRKSLCHVWMGLWCGRRSTNRHRAEFLKAAEPRRRHAAADLILMCAPSRSYMFIVYC